MKRLFVTNILISCLFLTLASLSAGMDQSEQDRFWLGVKMFSPIVGGDLDLETKLGSDGKLLLLIVYKNNRPLADNVVSSLRSMVSNISEHPVRIVATSDLSFKDYQAVKVAGIFISEQFTPNSLHPIVCFGIKRQLVVFSPFIGDVQQGVSAGIYISTQIKPAFNLTTINKSGIHMNKLFYKVAQTYD